MNQLNPDLQQLYSELMDRMRQGTEIHEELADYYNFLNLPGYQKNHEYHMLCELLTYQKAKDQYMREYNQLVQPSGMMNNMSNMGNNNGGGNSGNHGRYAQNIIPMGWYKYTRYDVDTNTKRNAVKEGFKKWLDYENETKQFLVNMGKTLEQKGEREAARKLDFLIDDVENEIEHAEQKMLALESAGYDINYIQQEQEPLKEKYANKIQKLNMRDHQYRKRGSGNYANYNYDDDDDDEERYARRYARRMR